MKPKIFILITDGVSLRNFVYSSFCDELESNGYEVLFWHSTPFDMKPLGHKYVKLKHTKLHPLTTSFKNAKKFIELLQFTKRFNEPVYKRYWFPLRNKNLKSIIRNGLSQLLMAIFNSQSGIIWLRNKINSLERKTDYYQSCVEVLQEYQPQLVYNTSQRSVLAIAAVQAAKSLNIPTVGFIYSWDNLPKATLDVETDYYHVWSEYMKDELLKYHPFIKSQQVTVTGTPQFEAHYKAEKTDAQSAFMERYNLEADRTYFCFSGDDVTTSPQDPLYLRDVAEAIRQLNAKGENIGLVFRRCPVDFSDRYEEVIQEYSDIIIPIAPLWENKQKQWNTIFPLPEDNDLLRQIARHCAAVINLGSSMVFDFTIHHKPCMYMNYTYKGESVENGVHVYDYIHFKSKPNDDVVAWLNHPETIAEELLKLLKNPNPVVDEAGKWFQVINQQPADQASVRIRQQINLHLAS